LFPRLDKFVVVWSRGFIGSMREFLWNSHPRLANDSLVPARSALAGLRFAADRETIDALEMTEGSAQVNDSLPDGRDGRVCPVLDVQFHKDRFEMRLHGVFRNEKR